MTGRTHLLLSATTYLSLALHPIQTPLGQLPPLLAGELVATPATPLLAIGAGTLLAAVFGLSPDADKSGSTVARSGGLSTRAAAWVVQKTLGHRGPLHSLAALLVAALLGEMLGRALRLDGLGGVVAYGWGAHLLLDACTARGVPLLWPLPFKLKLPPGLTTGGLFERLFVVVALLVCGWWAMAETMT